MNIEPPEEIEEYKETEEERRMRDERFIEKFFTERELIVKFDDTSDSDEKNAQAWYKAVEQTMNNLPIYQHDNVGQPLNNSSMSQNGEQSKTDSSAWFFRGQKDVKFAFNSTLYRQLLDKQRDKLLHGNVEEHEQAMLVAEKALIRMARNIGIGRELTALETLSLLQHHGSPTRLIDVTSDWKIALYFACESDNDVDGRIFLIKTNIFNWKLFPKEKNETKRVEHLIWQGLKDNLYDLNKPIEDPVFTLLWSTVTWPILLPFSDPRMIAQKGYFITGGIPSELRKIKLRTNKCSHCKKNRCACPANKTSLNLETIFTKHERSFSSPLDADELRIITSLPIDFSTNATFINELTNSPDRLVKTAGYSIRVPKHFKRKLREILRDEGVHIDSMYPPLRETVRLFEHVVDESFKQ
jgi:FRG domain protein